MTPHPAPKGGTVLDRASQAAATGTLGAGDLMWRVGDALSLALVMEPEVKRARALAMLPLAQVAVGEALAALAPPETNVSHRWDGAMLVNGAGVGTVSGRIAANDGVPDWLAVGVRLQLSASGEPGDDVSRTALIEEMGPLDPIEITETIARHWMVWLHRWDSEGFARVAREWDGRAEADHTVSLTHDGAAVMGLFVGLDEDGGALLRVDGTVRSVPLDALWHGPVSDAPTEGRR